MEYLDKNGTYLQRRKMYIGMPLHNMMSHIKFDWQNNDVSVQDQVGLKFKLNQQHEKIRKKYSETLDKQLHSKYVDHLENSNITHQDIQREYQKNQPDILSKEVQHFNHSKIIPLERTMETLPQNNQNQAQDRYAVRAQATNRSYDRLNQSLNIGDVSPINSSKNIRQSSYEPKYYENQADRNENYRYDRPYNPETYNTINTDRYRPYEPYPMSYNSSPLKNQKMYSQTIPNSYPFRNVIPDKLENHLRQNVKSEKKAVKVALNLFDYKKR